MDTRAPVKSADRTIALLETLARADRRLTLADLQRDLGYPKSSLYMLLQTLVGRGWVECDPTGSAYGIGVRALLVGTSYLDRDLLLAELEQARARGYASEREQNVPGLGCFAVALPYRLPVTDAISASIPLVRLDEAHQGHIVAALVQAARQITDLLRDSAV
ncbi:DNA-binding IclR family transcriptional regulator [Streptosporangium album]|uniref:Glycerol operon regulatory protein n=1 Tax=Streptosporangium album TaxID=47479 RepID=A0A7W7RYI5_9ACTN|nr:helix-turn-helix domain-containing protein [Streptosporangium album]MBB4940600.1 DNA-binding IclR family transcriptional regulator [Streptosporangium album]